MLWLAWLDENKSGVVWQDLILDNLVLAVYSVTGVTVLQWERPAVSFGIALFVCVFSDWLPCLTLFKKEF